MERLGTNYGGWFVPKEMVLNESSIVYSGGVGEDMSFDLSLQSKYNCNIFLIDPTKRAFKHFQNVKGYYEKQTEFSGDIQKDYINCIEYLNPNLRKMNYLDVGLWNEKTELKFYKQNNDKCVSQSLVPSMFGSDYDIVHVNTIQNIMKENNHSKIDLLKLDIEGAEVEVVDKMLDDGIHPRYVMIEFDLLLKKKDPENKTKKLIERMMRKEQYTILKNDNLNITFEYQIPVVIVHIGYKDYVRVNLEITGKTNKIYLIGDDSMKHLGKMHNVTFVDIDKYQNHASIVEARNSFINYSTNSEEFEWTAIQNGAFILKLFLEDYHLSKIFNMDSDNILLYDINKYSFKKDIAYCLNKNYHEFRMSNSNHCALFNLEYCNEFIQLYKDIYLSKKHFHLIEDKIRYHSENNIAGGINIMTLNYILVNERRIETQNLMNPAEDDSVFLNNINNAEGFESKQQYRLKKNMIDFYFSNGVWKIYDLINKKEYKLMNLHFQGGAKRFMTDTLIETFNY